jgi:hypothetical protein
MITGKLEKTDRFICENCCFGTNDKNDYNRHLLTAKHKNDKNDKKMIKNKTGDLYKCICNKEYKHQSGLCFHRKKCSIYKEKEENNSMILLEKEDIDGYNPANNELVIQLLKENKHFMTEVMEMVSKTLIINNNNNTMINNNTINNQVFNLNVFLNETCKDAMNLEDFLKTIVITNKDLDDIGLLGFVKAISNIIAREVGKLDENQRPFHCMDKKREIFYIKQNNIWKKEKKDVFKAMLIKVAHIYFKQTVIWKEEYPTYKDISTEKHEEYQVIMTQLMNCLIPDEKDMPGIEKIIRNITNDIIVNKNSNHIL